MKTTLQLGAQLENLTQEEMHQELAVHAQETYRQFARGCKYLRFGPLSATIASNAFSFDGTGTPGTGPRDGFIWTIRRLLVTGLATGATPDLINFYRGKPSGTPIWQLNGNSFGATFGKCEMLLLPGEVLAFANSGTTAATGTVTVSGDIQEVAAEEIFKLF